MAASATPSGGLVRKRHEQALSGSGDGSESPAVMKSIECTDRGGPTQIGEDEDLKGCPYCGLPLGRTGAAAVHCESAQPSGAAAREPELPGVPCFDGYLIRIGGEGWCWCLTTLSGQPDIPRIRFRDGRMWAY